ncbi:MAG: polysaccharide deacetylase family protein [Methylococcaceae bacterium]
MAAKADQNNDFALEPNSGKDQQLQQTLPDKVKVKYSKPVAGAGADQSVLDREGDGVEEVVLDGTASRVYGGEILSYKWFEGSKQLTDEALTTINLPVGEHTLKLEVTGPGDRKAADSVTIAIRPLTGNFQRLNLKAEQNKSRTKRSIKSFWPAGYGESNICLWEDDKFAAVTITIDDNIAVDHEWWVKAGKDYDWRFTWFIIVNHLTGKTKNPFYGSWEKFQTLVDLGHDIQSHSMSHQAHDDARLKDELIQEYRDSLHAINQHLTGNKATTFAWPSGKFNREVGSLFAIAARGTTATPNKPGTTDYLNVNSTSIGVSKDFVDSVLDGDSGIAWLGKKQFLRSWLSAHYHLVKDKTAVKSDLDYLYQRSNEVWLSLFQDVARYGQERDTATLKVISNNAKKVEFQVSDQMDDNFFDYPLTVKLKLYPSWSAVTASQANQTLTPIIVTHGKEKYALLKVIPDQGRVVVKPSDKVNQNPEAKAGQAQIVVDKEGDGSEPVVLNGRASYDEDGFIFQYRWTKAGDPVASVSRPTIKLDQGDHVFSLKVTDNSGAVAEDKVIITVQPPPQKKPITESKAHNDEITDPLPRQARQR